MEVTLKNTEITDIEYLNDSFTINTRTEKRVIKFEEFLGAEKKEIESDTELSGLGAFLGTAVGISLGDFTGAVVGAPLGAYLGGLFGKKKYFFLTFNILKKDPLTFVASSDAINLIEEEIFEHQDKFFENFLEKYNNSLTTWKNNLTKKLKNKNIYVSFADIFSKQKTPSQYISIKNLIGSDLFEEEFKIKLKDSFENFDNINNKRTLHNKNYINKNKNNKYLKGLIDSQKKAVLIDEENTLVNAGAGSGKTTTILHKIIHLLENDYCKGDEILILAYNKSVREELIERINKLNNQKIKDELNILTKKNVHTFHSFGYRQLDKKVSDIFNQASDSNKELEEKKNRILNNIINKLFENKEFKNALCSYFYKYFFTYKDLFEDIKTFEDYVNYVWNVERKTLNGDWVRSFEEVEISNYLYLNGIKFEYEKKYKGKTDFESLHNENDIKAKKHLRRREKYKGEYHPDFYLTDYDIYLEHFALNKNNEAPPFFKDRGKYYEQYLKKKELHKLNKTKLITTYSWQKQKGILTQSLEKKLKAHNVKFKTLKDSEIMEKFKETGNINSFCKLISTFMSHYKSNELEIDDIRKKRFLIPGITNWNRALIFINLFKKIFGEYQKILREDDSIDYDDMIIHGRKKIINENFKYILVDEFQDISQSRSKLLQTIKEKNKSKLFCVGDDWQSIYRFNGSDISIFTKDFEKQFGYFERVDIDTTFRFGNKINELTSSFIQKNPDQMKKTVRASDNTPEGSIVIYDFNDISKVAKEIIKKEKKGNIFILGRYNLDMYDKELKRRFFKSDIITKREVKEILKIDKRFNYKTVHKSKGLEAESVIIINMFKGAIGFPSETEDDELLILVLPNPEAFPYAEERRLFYVALTRAKKNIYIFTAEGFFSSNFIKELKENHLNLIDLKVKDDGNDKKSKKRICPTHKVKLIFKKGKYGPFYSCPKWKSGNCNYTENA